MRTAARLAAQVMPVSPDALVILARLGGNDTRIKAGSYEIERGTTPLGLIEKLTRGDVTLQELTIPEGWTFRQFRATLDAHAGVAHDTLGQDDAAVFDAVRRGEPAWRHWAAAASRIRKGSFIRTPICSPRARPTSQSCAVPTARCSAA